ncbi:PDZ domain-containing protein [Streptomyces sp. NPDC016845]|uniref:PDZ domain-containing protein n=1 Tax=Streptomyces sp. NPDC016845 TaxID=3364972 RepID=UPI0037992155
MTSQVTSRRPDVVRGGGRRTAGLLAGLLCGLVLVLAGVGLGAVGTTVSGMSRMAEAQERQETAAGTRPQELEKPSAAPPPSAPPAAARTRLGVEVADAPQGPGALVVAVHVPGPGYAAGLVRGDVVTRLGTTQIGSARDLVARVADARPGRRLILTVRHRDGSRQALAATPGLVT